MRYEMRSKILTEVDMCGSTTEHAGSGRPLCPVCSLSVISHRVGELNIVCEPCADRMLACKHVSGESVQRFDNDGAGYKVWRCGSCYFTDFDMV